MTKYPAKNISNLYDILFEFNYNSNNDKNILNSCILLEFNKINVSLIISNLKAILIIAIVRNFLKRACHSSDVHKSIL